MDLGPAGERVAAHHLETKGHRVIARNYRCRVGEIDIVSVDGDVIVFCEVKARRTNSRGAPFESVTRRKQSTLRRLAEHFLLTTFGEMRTCRFDVVSLKYGGTGEPEVLHIENAFW